MQSNGLVLHPTTVVVPLVSSADGSCQSTTCDGVLLRGEDLHPDVFNGILGGGST